MSSRSLSTPFPSHLFQVRLAKLLLDEGKADINAVNCKNMRPFDMCTTRYGKVRYR